MDLILKKKLLNHNDLELLEDIYKKLVDGHQVVALDDIYEQFKYIWKEETIEFLISNKDAFKMEDEDFINIEEKLSEYGFLIPSYEHVHQWFDQIQFTYVTSKGDVIHAAVVNVW